MKRAVLASVTVVASIAAAGGGFVLGNARPYLARSIAVVTAATAKASRGPIYYRDPDGKPFYSLAPSKTSDGRDYRVPPDADISFEDGPAAEPAAAEAERKIKYYRNPMGLPDTSPTPKKDAMGMDYIPVFEGEDTTVPSSCRQAKSSAPESSPSPQRGA
jgi:Cu(I)/Ag(I) efflux system membrane fusion protein